MGTYENVVQLARHAAFNPGDAVLLAAVGATLAAEPGGQYPEATDPGAGVIMTAGAATVRQLLPLELDRIEQLAKEVPLDEQVAVLSFAEGFLAQSHPRRTWELICNVVGAETAVENALGLDVAAHLGPMTRWEPGVVLPPVIERQLRADTTARAAVAGTVHGLDHPQLVGIFGDPGEIAMTPAQARVLLVAGAAAEPRRAVELAVHLLRYFPVHALAESLHLVAQIAVREGFAPGLAVQARAEGFVAEQCTWAAAAAAAGALNQLELIDLAARLAPRIEDELEPGRELIAGLALIEALLRLDAVDEAVGLAARWQLPFPVLLRRCLYASVGVGAGLLSTHPELVKVAESTNLTGEQCAPGGTRPWWQPEGADALGRLEAARDILTVVARTPWKVMPGSLADLLGARP